MKQLEELFQSVESHDFSAVANLASDLKTFVRILGSQKAVQTLGGEMRDPGTRTAICERVLSLARARGDEGYEHPWDSALAAYLWLLLGTDPKLAARAAEKVAEAPGCWWAGKMAEKALARKGQEVDGLNQPQASKITSDESDTT